MLTDEQRNAIAFAYQILIERGTEGGWKYAAILSSILAAPSDAAQAPIIRDAELAGELWRASVERELLDMTKAAERLSGPFQSGFLQCIEEIAMRLHLSDEVRNFSTQDTPAAPITCECMKCGKPAASAAPCAESYCPLNANVQPDERTAFEAWWVQDVPAECDATRRAMLKRGPDGRYLNDRCDDAWQAWQQGAHRAASQPTAQSDERAARYRKALYQIAYWIDSGSNSGRAQIQKFALSVLDGDPPLQAALMPTNGMDRGEFHDKAWALWHAKALDSALLPKLSIHAIRTLWDVLYDAMPRAASQPTAKGGEQSAAPMAAFSDERVYKVATWLAKKDGVEDDDLHRLIWEGNPPEPWGEIWHRYEDDARKLLAHIDAPLPRASEQADAPPSRRYEYRDTGPLETGESS